MSKVYNSRPVISNIVKNELVKSLKNNGIPCDYSLLDNELADYIDEKLTTRNIDENIINDIYYNLIFFGQHKCCYLCEFDEFDGEMLRLGMANIEKKYGITEPFIDFMLPLPKKEAIVAFEYSYHEKVLNTVKIVFRKEIKTTIGEEIKIRYVFVPIIINILQKTAVVMVNPKRDGAKEKEYVFSNIAKEYLDKLKSIFNLNWKEIRSDYAKYNHTITLKFANEIFRLAMGIQDDSTEEKLRISVESSSKIIEDFLENDKNITCLKEKGQQFSLLNIYESIQSIIENAVISNYIAENGKGVSASSKIGYISYLKFQDRAKSLMRMRGEYRNPITDSETFLSLRNDLKKYREISAIKIKWLMGGMKFDVKYELENLTTLMLRFYHDLNEGDYNNAIKEYEKYGHDDVI